MVFLNLIRKRSENRERKTIICVHRTRATFARARHIRARYRRHRRLRSGGPESRTIHAAVRSPVPSHIGVDQRQPKRHHRHGPFGLEDIFLEHSTARRARGLRRDGQSNVREQGTNFARFRYGKRSRFPDFVTGPTRELNTTRPVCRSSSCAFDAPTIDKLCYTDRSRKYDGLVRLFVGFRAVTFFRITNENEKSSAGGPSVGWESLTDGSVGAVKRLFRVSFVPVASNRNKHAGVSIIFLSRHHGITRILFAGARPVSRSELRFYRPFAYARAPIVVLAPRCGIIKDGHFADIPDVQRLLRGDAGGATAGGFGDRWWW